MTKNEKRIILQVSFLLTLFIIAIVFGRLAYGQTFSEPTRDAPIWVTAQEIYGGLPIGTPVMFHGWVQGSGGNKYGRWSDVLEMREYGNPKPRGIRVYHTFKTTLAKSEHVRIIGFVSKTGQIRANEITIDFLREPKR